MAFRTSRKIAATVALGAVGAVSFGANAEAGSLKMVNVQEAGVRTGPSYDGTELIKTKHYGDCVEALTGASPSGDYNWFQVRVGTGSVGWMRADLVSGTGC